MDGTAGLKNAETFEEWYSAFCDNLSEKTVRDGLVPATTYMAISPYDGRLIGMINIRHILNDYLLKFGVHIGYSISTIVDGTGELQSLHVDMKSLNTNRVRGFLLPLKLTNRILSISIFDT